MPKSSFWEQFYDNNFVYKVQYSTIDSFNYLAINDAFTNKQSKKTRAFYRHFITQFSQDISLALNVISGSPILYVSLDPSNKKPNSTHNEFNTKF